jgi:hypothetical protein
MAKSLKTISFSISNILNVLDSHINGLIIQEEQKGQYLQQDILLLLLQNWIQISLIMKITIIQEIIGIDPLDIMEEEANF